MKRRKGKRDEKKGEMELLEGDKRREEKGRVLENTEIIKYTKSMDYSLF